MCCCIENLLGASTLDFEPPSKRMNPCDGLFVHLVRREIRSSQLARMLRSDGEYSILGIVGKMRGEMAELSRKISMDKQDIHWERRAGCAFAVSSSTLLPPYTSN